jgi:glucose/arabinose dehydrogenase
MMPKSVRLLGGTAVLAAVVLAPIAAAQQGGRGGQPGGRGQGGGRGAVRPECLKPVVPAAECNIAPGINWPSPPLGDGPFLLETAVPEHRNIRVVVVTRALNQPWSAAWLPDGTMLVT